jgi:hypothetical protein
MVDSCVGRVLMVVEVKVSGRGRVQMRWSSASSRHELSHLAGTGQAALEANVPAASASPDSAR